MRLASSVRASRVASELDKKGCHGGVAAVSQGLGAGRKRECKLDPCSKALPGTQELRTHGKIQRVEKQSQTHDKSNKDTQGADQRQRDL